MRFFLVLPVLWACATWCSADEADDILAKAIKAQAKDAETLKKLATHVCVGKGKGRLGEGMVDVTMLRQAVWPGSFRIGFTFGKSPQQFEAIIGLQDDRGWHLQGGVVGDLPTEKVNEVRMDAYGAWVGMLVSLHDSGVKLSTLPSIKIAGEPMVGLKVTRRPWPEMTLYFDEKTMLLRKQIFRSPDGGVVKTKEHWYEDYKSFEGIQLPTKFRTTLAGTDVFVWDTLEYTFPATLDKELFQKPQPKK